MFVLYARNVPFVQGPKSLSVGAEKPVHEAEQPEAETQKVRKARTPPILGVTKVHHVHHIHHYFDNGGLWGMYVTCTLQQHFWTE